MSILVKIDNRERHIKELIQPHELLTYNIQYENLEHGDIVVLYEGAPMYVFERKTFADLRASIHDGRYTNQKINMIDAFGRNRVFYIIEGDDPIREDALTGAIINTMLRDKIGVFKTNDIHATVQLIFDIVRRINNDPHSYINTLNQELRPCVANRKESLFFRMICQLPHISIKTAKAIQQKYTCFNDLRQVLDTKTHDERMESLKEICILDKHNKVRKISSAACENLIKAYYGEGTQIQDTN